MSNPAKNFGRWILDKWRNREYFKGDGELRKKHKNRLKRIADCMEKLGAGGMIYGLFRNEQGATWVGLGFMIASIIITTEDR